MYEPGRHLAGAPPLRTVPIVTLRAGSARLHTHIPTQPRKIPHQTRLGRTRTFEPQDPSSHTLSEKGAPLPYQRPRLALRWPPPSQSQPHTSGFSYIFSWPCVGGMFDIAFQLAQQVCVRKQSEADSPDWWPRPAYWGSKLTPSSLNASISLIPVGCVLLYLV